VVDGRRLAEAEAAASRLDDANALLRGGADWDELTALRAEAEGETPAHLNLEYLYNFNTST
jgi:hypothetical protein